MISLTQEEQRIIAIIREQKRATLQDLVKKLNANKSSVHYQIRGLIKKGILIEEKKSAHAIYFSLANAEEIKKLIKKQTDELSDILLKVTIPGNKKPKLVFSDWYILPDEMIKKLEEKYEVITYPNTPSHISQETFCLRCKDANIVVTFFSVYITREMLEQCQNLKAVVHASISIESIDISACKDLGIAIYSLSKERNYKKGARTEFIFVSLFSLLRPIYKASESLRIGKFDYQGLQFEELRGKSIGIVGIKREGREIIPILRMFGCTIMISNPDNLLTEPADLGISEFSEVKELFDKCDIVIFPEEYASTIYIDHTLMTNKMKAQYFLFHSYSLKLDVDLFRELIISKKIKSIAIDYVAEVFNIFDDFLNSEYKKIMNFPNVCITPELGFYTKQALERNYQEVFEILTNINL